MITTVEGASFLEVSSQGQAVFHELPPEKILTLNVGAVHTSQYLIGAHQGDQMFAGAHCEGTSCMQVVWSWGPCSVIPRAALREESDTQYTIGGSK